MDHNIVNGLSSRITHRSCSFTLCSVAVQGRSTYFGRRYSSFRRRPRSKEKCSRTDNVCSWVFIMYNPHFKSCWSSFVFVHATFMIFQGRSTHFGRHCSSLRQRSGSMGLFTVVRAVVVQVILVIVHDREGRSNYFAVPF